jgi:hypothetical protein
VRQVLLVVLNHERHGARVDRVLGEIGVEILKALDVFSSWRAWLSATNTTPSAPWRTSLRVVW